ncbi:MAG: M20 family metallopeptidase [Proteobacteria bacterium]|nr:M20 family metallopeptidase [Pseudomonadota bacterium]MBU1739684.1 M20 family metallopeptidase [Pseudomonadota bacterium]
MPSIPDVITMTRELVGIPSESSDPVGTDTNSAEKMVVAYLRQLCLAAGIEHCTREALPGRDNLLVRLPNPGAPKVLIVAHMDTVSARGMDEPFSGRMEDGRIMGRGSCDDKGPLAAGLSALLALHGKKIVPAYDVTFAASVDEECTMSGAESLAREIDDFALCIALEPTNLQIIRAHKGVYRCRIITRGLAAHSSHPEKGRNAVTSMVMILNDIDSLRVRLARNKHPDLGRASLAVTTIKGGASVNAIPDYCEAVVDIRILPDMFTDEVGKLVREYVDGRGEVEEIYTGDGISTSMENPLILSLADSIVKEGCDPGPVTASFATDCSRLHQKGPCIVWGPGDIHQAHQAVEYVLAEQLEQAQRILTGFLTGGHFAE